MSTKLERTAYRNSQLSSVGVSDSDSAYVDNRRVTSAISFDSATFGKLTGQSKTN